MARSKYRMDFARDLSVSMLHLQSPGGGQMDMHPAGCVFLYITDHSDSFEELSNLATPNAANIVTQYRRDYLPTALVLVSMHRFAA